MACHPGYATDLESSYRDDLIRDPSDTRARLRLSWCLFVQAVHAAGRESLLKEMSETDRDLSERLPQFLLSLSGDQVDGLLRDCLRQTTAVMHLSRDQSERSDVEVLHTLIKLAGAEHCAVGQAREADLCLYELTRAIVMDSSGPRMHAGLRRVRVSQSETGKRS